MVREATLDDAPAIARLAARTFHLACPPTTSAEAIAAHIRDELNAERFAEHMVASDFFVVDAGDGEVCGYVMIAHDPPPIDQDWSNPVELRRIYVDTDRHSNLRVWDYKTGQSRNFSRLKQDNPTASGRFLQLPIYAIAAETSFGRGPLPTQAKYWFLSGGSRDKPIGYAVTDEVKERALSVVEVVLDGYRRGIFPPRPKVHSHLYDCPSCQPDGADRLTKEGFELLLQADELADYRAVIDE